MTKTELANIKQKIVSRLSANPNVGEIILFGSYAWGQPNKDSDVDLLIILNQQGLLDSYMAKLRKRAEISDILEDIEKNIPIDVLVYTREEWDKILDLGSSFAKKIISQGLRLR